MPARSDDPAKRCDKPQSLSASAAGRRRDSMSARISMAADKRADGVMANAAALANDYFFFADLFAVFFADFLPGFSALMAAARRAPGVSCQRTRRRNSPIACAKSFTRMP